MHGGLPMMPTIQELHHSSLDWSISYFRFPDNLFLKTPITEYGTYMSFTEEDDGVNVILILPPTTKTGINDLIKVWWLVGVSHPIVDQAKAFPFGSSERQIPVFSDGL